MVSYLATFLLESRFVGLCEIKINRKIVLENRQGGNRKFRLKRYGDGGASAGMQHPACEANSMHRKAHSAKHSGTWEQSQGLVKASASHIIPPPTKQSAVGPQSNLRSEDDPSAWTHQLASLGPSHWPMPYPHEGQDRTVGPHMKHDTGLPVTAKCWHRF